LVSGTWHGCNYLGKQTGNFQYTCAAVSVTFAVVTIDQMLFPVITRVVQTCSRWM
jgi:hypothetical protein